MTAGGKSAIQARGTRVAAAHKEAQLTGIREARHGWDASPISVPRMVAELGEQIKNDDWAIVSGHQFTGDWQRRLLNYDKHYRYNGDCGGFGIGYDTPASVGGALAHKKAGRLSIGDRRRRRPEFQSWRALDRRASSDPAALRRAQQPRVSRRGMIIQRMCGVRGRGNENAHIGNVICDPNRTTRRWPRCTGSTAKDRSRTRRISPGRISARWPRSEAGEPALVEVVSQPR